MGYWDGWDWKDQWAAFYETRASLHTALYDFTGMDSIVRKPFTNRGGKVKTRLQREACMSVFENSRVAFIRFFL